MNQMTTLEPYGALGENATLTIQRMLPGPAERVRKYLTDSDLRRKWLAAGDMDLREGATFEWTWRNDELTDPPGTRPDGFGVDHAMTCSIMEIDAPRKLVISWGSTGGVTFELEPRGERVLLTVIHRRLPDRTVMLNVAAGWHAHLDLLAADMEGRGKGRFWDDWRKLKDEYDRRLPG